ncbi:MAG: hypothetical protein L3J69_17775 [Desulfobacula sp.]|nr:hypothetical protein [Desulfobacula sp.]
MNISGKDYNTYSQGYPINPISRIKYQSPGTDSKNKSQLNPVVNPTPFDQAAQIPKSNNSISNTYTSYKPGANLINKGQPAMAPAVRAPAVRAPANEISIQNTQDQEKQPENTTTVNGNALTQAELQLVETLRQVDSEVRSHEMAHIAAGGQFITSGAGFSYKKGPDGKNYAVEGEVGIDISPVPGDPAATIQKMFRVKSAALAPANPSSQDLRVASKASSTATKAVSELMILATKEKTRSNGKTLSGNLKNAAGSYEKVNNLPETESSTFQIDV